MNLLQGSSINIFIYICTVDMLLVQYNVGLMQPNNNMFSYYMMGVWWFQISETEKTKQFQQKMC